MFIHDNSTDQRKPQDLWIEKCTAKKRDSMRAAELGQRVMKPTRVTDLEHCGDVLTFLHSKDLEKTKLETGWFCHNRLCPGCAWRQAARDAVAINCILQEAVEMGNGLLFATMTAQNVKASELKDAVRDYNKAYVDMMRRGKFRMITGAIRKLEITYNAEKDTYHPHIHSVWIVPKRWNEKRNPNRISRDELCEAWAKELKYKYATNAGAQDIRMIKSARQEDILEFAKYPAKAGDYLYNQEVFETFYNALRDVRLITPMRLARKLKTAYKAGELDRWKEADQTEYFYRSMWNWAEKEYRLAKLDELEKPLILGVCDYNEEVMGDG